MKVEKKNWRTFEELSGKIYALLDSGAEVKHDDRIYGYQTKKERQIDVSIRSRIAGHDILVIVQARDRARAPDINVVGEFAQVIEDVCASKGVIVCRKEPRKHVVEFARKKRIDFCSIFDVDDRKWSDDVVVPLIVTIVTADITPSLTILRTADSPLVSYQPGRTRFRVSKDNGASSLDLLEFASQLVVGEQIALTGKHKLDVSDDELKVEIGGVWLPLPSVSFNLNADVCQRFRYCRPDEYSALMNYSAGEFSMAKLKLQFPPLIDDAEWQSVDSIDPSSQVVTQHVPIVDLRFSELVESGGICFSVQTDE